MHAFVASPSTCPSLTCAHEGLRALLWVPSAIERSRIVGWLTEAGHEVIPVANETELRIAFQKRPVDVALVAVDDGDDENLRLVRSLASAQGTFLLALIPFRAESSLGRFYDAGADGDLIVPCSPPLFASRLRAIERLKRRVEGRLEPLDVAVRATARAAEQIQSAVSEMLGVVAEVEGAGRPAPDAQIASAACVFLLSAAQGLEIRIAVGGDEASTRAIAAFAFGGEASDDLVIDLLKELANLLMGSLKASLTAAEIACSSGVPIAIAPHHLQQPPASYAHRDEYTVVVGGRRLVVQIAMRTKLHRFVKPTELREGMVLARDLRNEQDLMLLPIGSRLSEHLLEKLANALPPTMRIEVLIA